jgi:hypothetical protein
VQKAYSKSFLYLIKSNGIKMKGITSHKFGKDLYDTPLIITTAETEKGIVTMIENVPVFTFRGGSFKRDILNVTKDQKEALKFHMAVLEGKK